MASFLMEKNIGGKSMPARKYFTGDIVCPIIRCKHEDEPGLILEIFKAANRHFKVGFIDGKIRTFQSGQLIKWQPN